MSGTIEPRTAEHFRVCGNASFVAENYSTAVKFYLKALDIAGEGEAYSVLSNMSAAYLKLGQVSSAIRAANECVHLSPETPKGYLRLFRAYEQSAENARAVETLHTCVSTCKKMSKKDTNYIRKLILKLKPKVEHEPIVDQLSTSKSSKETEFLFHGYPLSMQELNGSIMRLVIESIPKVDEATFIFHKRSIALCWEEGREEKVKHPLYITTHEIIPAKCSWIVVDSRVYLDLCKANIAQRWVEPFIQFEDFKALVKSINIRLDVSVLQSGDIHVEVDEHSRGRLLQFSDSISIIIQYLRTATEIDRKCLQGDALFFKLPSESGRYEARVVLDSLAYCVATSEPIAVLGQGIPAHVETVPYLVLKDTNLLCYNVYMPLQPLHSHPGGASRRDASEPLKAKRLETTVRPTTIVPSMRVEGQRKDHLVVYLPRDSAASCAEETARTYADIRLDVPVDIDRSKMQLYGSDFLYIKLPFASMSSSALAQQERELLHADCSELDVEHYAEGLQCRTCKNPIVTAIDRIEHAPFSPWTALLEHITCVAPEEYKGGGGDPAFGISRVAAPEHGILMDQAFIQLGQNSVRRASYALCEELNGCAEPCPEDFAGESEMKHIQCSRCKSWLGYLIHNRNKAESEHDETAQLRLFKCCITSSPLDVFSSYSNSSACLVGSLVARRSNIEECQRFIVQTVDSQTEKCLLLLWSKESWMRTEQNSKFQPAMKVLFNFCKDVDDDEFSLAHPITLRKKFFDALKKDLIGSNLLLPPSCRYFQKDMRIGFIRW